MFQFIVYFTKHVSGYTMRYGIYPTFHEAAEALKAAKAVNSTDEWFIEEKWVKS